MEQEYTIDNSYLSPEAQKRKKDLEENPASRTNHMEYMDGMEVLDSDIKDKVRAAMQSYDYNAYTDADVRTALANAKQGHCGIEDFKALLSPAAAPYLEQMARKAAEMFAARDIEDYYSKQQIFEMYAGSCYFGNQWSGVAQAAQGYFGKPTRELTRAECVVLAGLPNAPSVYAANGELARRRALVVVERMERAKKLTHTQALELRDEVSALPLW